MSKARTAFVVVLASLSSAGCWEQVSKEWFAQMKEQPAVQALEGIQPLEAPEGTVPVGGISPRIGPDDPMFLVNPMYSEKALALVNPVPADAESLARGKALYSWNCTVCHAEDGMSSPANAPVAGLLAKAGAPPFPLSTTVAFTDGQIYTKIRYGKPNMPGYPQIGEEDRWHVVNYLRTLFKGG